MYDIFLSSCKFLHLHPTIPHTGLAFLLLRLTIWLETDTPLLKRYVSLRLKSLPFPYSTISLVAAQSQCPP